MRSDMPKVIRDNHRAPHGGSAKTGKRLSFDEVQDAIDEFRDDEFSLAVHGTSMSGAKKQDTREMEIDRDYRHGGVRYNPIRRYLLTRVGHQWNDVYSDIRAQFTNRKDYADIEYAVKREIAIDAYKAHDGSIWHYDTYGLNRCSKGSLYVDVADGIVKVVTKQTVGYWYRWAKNLTFGKTYPVTEIKLDNGTFLVHDEKSGCWFQETRTAYTVDVPKYGYSYKDGLKTWTVLGTKQETRYKTSRKQMNHKELKQHGLTNGPLEHRPKPYTLDTGRLS